MKIQPNKCKTNFTVKGTCHNFNQYTFKDYRIVLHFFKFVNIQLHIQKKHGCNTAIYNCQKKIYFLNFAITFTATSAFN